MEYLPIKKENIKKKPYKFTITIQQETYIFIIYYNQMGEFFSFDVYNINNDLIAAGRKIVAGTNMMKDITNTFDIIPLSLSTETLKTGITYNNFMLDIKPYIFEGGF